MKYPFLFIFLLLNAIFSEAQSIEEGAFDDPDYAIHNNTDLSVGTTFYPYGLNGEKKVHITLWADYFSNSTSLSHSFVNKLLLGGSIDASVKEGIDSKLQGTNRAGVELTGGLSLAIESDKILGGNTTFFINASYDLNQNVSFSDEFYNLIFVGNAQYENDTAQFSGLNFNSFAYQQYKFGMAKRFNGEKVNFQLGAALGFVQGLTNTRGNLEEGYLFTAEDGDYIDVRIKGLVERSNTGAYDLFALNGKGYSIDLHAALEIRRIRTVLRLDMLDLGQVNWNEQAVKYDVDTSYRFEGVDVNDLFDLSESALTGEPDSLINYLGFEEEAHQYSTGLPTALNLAITHYFPKSLIHLTLGGGYRLNSNYRTNAYLKASKHFHKPSVDLGMSFSYGGYGKHTFGIEFGKIFNDQIGILVGSRALLSYLMPKTTTGTSLYVQLSASF